MIKTICFAIVIIYRMFLIESSEYGPFELKVTKVVVCKGPKLKNCAEMGAELANNGKSLALTMNVSKSFSPQLGKITAISNGKQLLRMQMNKPCEHLFLRPLFEMLMNVTSNCIVRMGNYRNQVNIEKVAKDYYGGTFVYGNLTFKVLFFSSDCNMCCINLDIMFYPAHK